MKILAVVQKFQNKKKNFTWDTKIVVLETAAPKRFMKRKSRDEIKWEVKEKD